MASELMQFKAYLAFKALPKPGKPMEEQPARFCSLLEYLMRMAVIRG